MISFHSILNYSHSKRLSVGVDPQIGIYLKHFLQLVFGQRRALRQPRVTHGLAVENSDGLLRNQ